MKVCLTALKSGINIALAMFLFTASLNAQEGITFSFANAQITGSGPSYLEFDILAHAASNSQFKLGQIYIDYNTDAFGSNISGTTSLTITKGGLLSPVINGDIGSYNVSSANNTSSRIAIQNDWQKTDLGGGKSGYDLSNTLGTSDQVYVHVKLQIQDPNKPNGISFNTSVSQWDQQDYYFTTGDNETNYAPVAESGTISIPLPVELTSFKAKTEGSMVDLSWKTATEVDNYGFEIERLLKNDNSFNSSSENTNWINIGFVKGSGNSNSPKSYSFEDKSPEGGTNFEYRLKQIDVEGKYTYSNIVNVMITPSMFVLYQNYPNPFNPSTKIKYEIPKEEFVSLKVYDELGREIKTLVDRVQPAGYYRIIFNASNLASGIYIYTIKAGSFYSVRKLVLLK